MVNLTDEQMAQIKQFVETFPEEERGAKMEEVLAQLAADEKKPQTPQCPFCLMTEGKLKVNKVFEDNDFMAVLEINPANPGHVLLFPKLHVQELNALKNTLPDFLLLANSLASSLLSFNPGVNILFSQGVAAGQRFPHLVVNIIPRVEKDEVTFSWKPKPSSEEQLVSLKEKTVKGLVKPVPEKKFDRDAFVARLPSSQRRKP